MVLTMGNNPKPFDNVFQTLCVCSHGILRENSLYKRAVEQIMVGSNIKGPTSLDKMTYDTFQKGKILTNNCVKCAVVGNVTSLRSKNNPNAKIYNGRDADEGEYRWMAWLYDKTKNKMVCGASLVDAQWVLTTAACASKEFDNVVVGDYNMFESDGEQLISATDVFIHPFYDPSNYANDVALIKLAYEVDLENGHAEVLKRIISPKLTDMEKRHCMISGWGLTLSNDYFWPTPKKLQELRVKIVDGDTCIDEGLKLTRNTFCFKSYRAHGSPCMRDEGSPIVCKINSKWTQVGMYSFARKGDGCKFGPKGATHLYPLRGWIKTTIRNN